MQYEIDINLSENVQKHGKEMTLDFFPAPSIYHVKNLFLELTSNQLETSVLSLLFGKNPKPFTAKGCLH